MAIRKVGADMLLSAALLPAIVLMVYVYRKDTIEKEPVRMLVGLFAMGMVAGPLAAVVENLLFSVFESMVPPGTLLVVLEFFIGVAAVEEGFKYLFLNTVRKHPEFNYVFDGIVYAVAVALGFAALENVLYVLDGGLEVAVTRAIFSVPGHCADGVVMGCFFGMAKQCSVLGDRAGARRNYVLAFVLPAIEHGFYDAGLSSDNDLMVLLALVVEIAFIAYAMVLVNRISKADRPLVPATPQGRPAQPQGPAPYAPGAPQAQQPQAQQPQAQPSRQPQPPEPPSNWREG